MFMPVKYEHPELIVEISRLYILTEKDANCRKLLGPLFAYQHSSSLQLVLASFHDMK